MVNFTLPWMRNATISISMLQTVDSWVLIFHIYPPIAVSSYILYDMPWLALHMNVSFWGSNTNTIVVFTTFVFIFTNLDLLTVSFTQRALTSSCIYGWFVNKVGHHSICLVKHFLLIFDSFSTTSERILTKLDKKLVPSVFGFSAISLWLTHFQVVNTANLSSQITYLVEYVDVCFQ